MSKWRDQQLMNVESSEAVVLYQETYLLDFLKDLKNPKIFYMGFRTNLLDIISERYKIVNDIQSADTLILFNTINGLTVRETQSLVREYLGFENIKNFYLGINRYAFKVEQLDGSLPDDLGESIDVIVNACDPNFVRLARFDNISGNTFVFSHPMDLFKLCR